MEGSYYTASFYKTFSAREKRLMNELFGPNYPKEDLNDNSISRILSKLRPPAQAKMKVPELLPNMKRHWCLTESELEDIKNESLSHYEQVLALLDSLQNRGSYGIGSLYLSLRESSDEMYGTPTHYQLAFELKSIIHAEVNRVTQLLTDTQDSKSPVKEELGGLIACFRGVAVAQEEAESLVDFLGLPVGQFPDRPDDLASVLFLWYRKRSVGGSLVDIVEALMLTRGLGRHVVLLCKNGSHSDCSCAHAVEGFLHGLGDRWLAIPEYLGYSRQEVVAITSDGVVGFLDEWQMPDCGQKTLMLLQKLKSLAGIQDSRTTGSSRPVTKVNPTQSLLLDSCDFSNPSPFSSLPARTVRLSPRPRPSTPPPSPPPSPRHQSSPEESKPLSYDKSYFQQTGKLVFIRLESKTYQDDGYYDDGSYRTTTKQHSPPSIEEVMDDETPVQSKLSRTTEPSDSHVTNRHSKTTNENNFTEMNNFEAMNNFGSVEDGVSSAAQPKAALVNSFDSLAAVDKEEGMVQMSAQNSLEMDAGHRPEQQAPSSPPPSPVSPSQQTVSTESAQQPNLTASTRMLTPPNSPQSSPGHHTSLSQGTSSPSQVTSSQVQEPSSLQPNQPPAASGEEDPLDSSLPSHAAGQLDHRNTIAAASVEGEHGVCDWDMVDAIREEDGMEMLTSLLDGGSSVNLPLKNDSGDYPLHLAVLSGSEVKVRTLLDHGATVDVKRAKDQRTPLLLACHSKGCSSSIITILVNQGADVAALDKKGQCVLHSSELLLQSDLAAMILNKDHSLADTHSDDHITPLTVACRVGDEACTTAELLISKGAGINGFSRAVETPLMAASAGGHIRLVELLLRSGANINKSDRKTRTTPLLKACLNSRFEVAKTLLDAGADVTLPDKDGKTPLVGAVVICCEDIVALLVNHPGVDVNYSRTLPDRFNRMQGVTPLADAAARGKVPIVRMLVEHGAHINKTSEDPDTSLPPITFAAMLGLTDVLQYFLSLPELDCSLEGLTKPVTVAIEQKQIGCARLLVDKYGGLEKMRADADNQELLDQLQQLAEQISAEETRSSHEAASEDQKPEGTALSDEDPFTSRPKSPPPLPDTDQQQQHLSSDLSSMISQQSFQSEAAEVLNDFAQYLIHASVQRNTPETIILKAESIGEPHLVTFFVRYFHDSSSISRWGEFVGDFLKGFPSPLNFLLSFRLASRSEFEKIIKEVGRPDFSEQLMLAFHQFPNSESLPWTASGLMDAMFEQPLGGLRDEYALREQLQQHLESAQRSIGQQSSSTIESSTAAGGFNAPGHRLGTAAEVKQQQRQQQQDDWQQDENLINASSIAASEARQEMESSQEVEPELNSFPATDEVPSACDSYNNLNDLDTADEAEPTTMEEPRSREPPPVTNSLSTGGAAVAKPLSFSDTPISSTSDTETIPAAKPLAYSNAVPKTPTPLNAVPMTPTPLNAVPMTPTPLNAVPKTPTPLNAVPKTLPSSNALSAAKPLPPSSSASVSALPVSTTAAAKPSQSPINLYPEVRANRGQHQHSHRTTATPTPTTPPITIHSNSPNPSRSQSSPSPPLSSRKLSAAAGTSSDSDSALPPPQPPSTSTTALTSLTTTTSQGETQPVQSAPLMSSTDSEDENPLSRMAASVAAEKRTMSIKGTAATSVGRMNDKKGGASVLAGKSGKTVRPPLSAAKHQADKTSTKPLATGGGRSSTKPLPSSATKPSLTAATKSLLGSRSSSTESLKKAAGTAKTTSTGITVKTTAKTTPTVTAAGVGRGKRPSSADKLTKSVAATTASDKKGTASPKTRRAGEVTSSKPAAKQEDNKPKATKQEDNQPTSAAASKPAIQEKEHEVTAVGVAHKPQAPPITEPSKAARDTVTSVLLPDHSDPSHPVQKSKTSSPQAESTHSVQSWTPSLQGSLLPSLQESLPSNQLTEGDDILKKLAPQLTNWKMLARYLLLEDSEIDHISLSYMFPVEQAYQMLRAWVRRSDDSTFAVLGEALSNCLKEDLVLQLAQYTRQQQSSLTEKREGEIEGVSELTSLWSTIQPHVDSFAKQGYSKVHVQMTFYK